MTNRKKMIKPEAMYKCPICHAWFTNRKNCVEHIGQHEAEADCVRVQLYMRQAEGSDIWEFFSSNKFKHSPLPQDRQVQRMNYNGSYYWEIVAWEVSDIKGAKEKLFKAAAAWLKDAQASLCLKRSVEDPDTRRRK